MNAETYSEELWDAYFPGPPQNAEHPIARSIIRIPIPSSMDANSIAADHLDMIGDELFEDSFY